MSDYLFLTYNYRHSYVGFCALVLIGMIILMHVLTGAPAAGGRAYQLLHLCTALRLRAVAPLRAAGVPPLTVLCVRSIFPVQDQLPAEVMASQRPEGQALYPL